MFVATHAIISYESSKLTVSSRSVTILCHDQLDDLALALIYMYRLTRVMIMFKDIGMANSGAILIILQNVFHFT